jgi:hypothetical protein
MLSICAEAQRKGLGMASVKGWEKIERSHVERAMREFDAAADQSSFLKRLGFAPARTRILLHKGRHYPSKALIGLARSYALNSEVENDFHGGEGTGLPVTILKNLKFTKFVDGILRDDTRIPEEVEGNSAGYPEGSVEKVLVNKYERRPEARAECLKIHGYICKVCKFDFKKRYGEHGAGFIHVHHTKKLSEVGKGYVVNPKTDLVPVCPNCHAMIHRTKDMLTIEKLRKMLRPQ